MTLPQSKGKRNLVRCAKCGHERELAPPPCPNCGAQQTVPLHL